MQTLKKKITIDNDTVEIEFRFDELWNVWLGDWPFFAEEPRYTPNGRPWHNVTHEGCPYASCSQSGDCSGCPHFKRQNPKDMIGVCFNDALKIDAEIQANDVQMNLNIDQA